MATWLLVTVITTILALTCQGKNVLLTEDKLCPGQSLDEGSYSLKMQHTCNLALFDGIKAIWTSNTGLNRRCFAVMQTDGNFVIYDQQNNVVWHSNTRRIQPRHYVLVLREDRNVVIYGPGLWDAGTNVRSSGGVVSTTLNQGRNILLSGQKLDVGQSLDEGSYSLRMQNSCNLALFDGSMAIWNSNTGLPNRRCSAHMQTNGNFVIYTSNGSVVWATNTTRGNTPRNYTFVLQVDRNIAIYGPIIWSTGTGVRSAGGVVRTVVNGTADGGFIESQSATTVGKVAAAAAA